jgi:hypothetical protein
VQRWESDVPHSAIPFSPLELDNITGCCTYNPQVPAVLAGPEDGPGNSTDWLLSREGREDIGGAIGGAATACRDASL